MPDVGSRTSHWCLEWWTGLKTPVTRVTCGTEYLEVDLALAVVKLALVMRCTLMGLEHGKHELFLWIFDTSSKPFSAMQRRLYLLYLVYWLVCSSVFEEDDFDLGCGGTFWILVGRVFAQEITAEVFQKFLFILIDLHVEYRKFTYLVLCYS